MTTKKNKRNLRAWLLAAATASICLCGCSGDPAGDDDRLPDGKYPMTFNATVGELTATRAAGKDTWTEGDAIAIQIGDEVKKYTAATDGSLSIAEGGTPFYWQSTSDITVSAWYPYSDTKLADNASTVKANQNQDGNYLASDLLEAVGATVKFNQTASLVFKHRAAKVVVTLQAGDFVSDLTGATVTFVNQIGVENNGTEVIPKTETIDNVPTYSAFLIPQNMQGQQFIKVALGGKNYYYTPKGMENANLQAGYVINYTITVKQNGLSVVWQKGEQIDDTAEEATFQTHLADFTAPDNTSSYAVADADGNKLIATSGVYSTKSNEISISLSADDSYRLKTFLTGVIAGICKQRISYVADTRTYTYTFYDIRSDLWLSAIQAEAEVASTVLPDPKVGDYYYVDGTWSSDLAKPYIGIVFKVGAGESDNVSDYGEKLTSIHGYVVALSDAYTHKCAWGGDGVLISTSTNQDDFAGYSNTQKIIAKALESNHLKPDDAQYDYPAVYYISEYDKTAPVPSTSSGWYFPSTGQLKEVYKVKDNIHNDVLKLQSGDYLSSSEYENRNYIAFNVGYVSFSIGISGYKEKDTDLAYVRAILTF